MRSKAAAHLRSPPFHAFDDGNMLGAAAHNERERERERERGCNASIFGHALKLSWDKAISYGVGCPDP